MSRSQVSVIVCHQLDINRPYLDLALKGLENSVGVDLDLILLSGAESSPPQPIGAKIVWDKSLNTATKKIERGMEMASSELVLLHSDDVIVSETAIRGMAEAFADGSAYVMNPFSNSDCRSQYLADIYLDRGLESKLLTHDMTLEDLGDWADAIINYPGRDKCLVPVQAISMYCTMLRKSTWQLVGGLDPVLENQLNDVDFCMRARQHGVPSVINFGEFAFHFGSRTLRNLDVEQDKVRAQAHFKKKWQLP